MNSAKAHEMLSALEQHQVQGRDPDDKDAPVLETRYAFEVRLIAGSADEGRTRLWKLRVTALHDAADWRAVFSTVAMVDRTTYAKSEAWPKTKIRVDNAGMELS